jgi:hypothetical protein
MGGADIDGEVAGASSLGKSAAEGGVTGSMGSTGGPVIGGGVVTCCMGTGGAAAVGDEFGGNVAWCGGEMEVVDAGEVRLGGGERRSLSSPS